MHQRPVSDRLPASPTASPTVTGRPPPSARRRGSDKAFKYLKARFTQSHVKVQNLSLLVRPLPSDTFAAHAIGTHVVEQS